MTTPLYVLVGGYKRSGKNTVAKFAREELIRQQALGLLLPKERVTERSFARPLKEIAVGLYRWNGEKDTTPAGIYGRAVLQVLGDALREVPERTEIQMARLIQSDPALRCPTDTEARTLARVWFAEATRSYSGFDPLIDTIIDTAEASPDGPRGVRSDDDVFFNPFYKAPADVVFITDTRMPFEFERFDGDAIKVWITRDGTGPGSHVTEQLDPATIPGVSVIENVNGNPYKAGGELFVRVRAALAARTEALDQAEAQAAVWEVGEA